MSTRILVFTDIDGTLIDIDNGDYSATKDLIKKLQEMDIPVIFCSNKTEEELEKIRRETGLCDPFIVENGGAILIPNNYFQISDRENFNKKYSVINNEKYEKIELGKNIKYVINEIKKIGKKYNIELVGVHDLSDEELAEKMNMDLDSAKRMRNRQYGETIIEINREKIPDLIKYAKAEGVDVNFGGKFYSAVIGHNKGKAVAILKDLFRKKYPNENLIFIGVGDSKNDESMLELMDMPLIVQNKDLTWVDLKIKTIVKVSGIGPLGWKEVYNRIIDIITPKV